MVHLKKKKTKLVCVPRTTTKSKKDQLNEVYETLFKANWWKAKQKQNTHKQTLLTKWRIHKYERIFCVLFQCVRKISSAFVDKCVASNVWRATKFSTFKYFVLLQYTIYVFIFISSFIFSFIFTLFFRLTYLNFFIIYSITCLHCCAAIYIFLFFLIFDSLLRLYRFTLLKSFVIPIFIIFHSISFDFPQLKYCLSRGYC